MNIANSIKNVTLATILATTALLPGCGKNSSTNLQEDWEMSPKVESRVDNPSLVENGWIESKYVTQFNRNWRSKFANRAYFLIPGKQISDNAKGRFLPYEAEIYAESASDGWASPFSQSQIDEKENSYVSVKVINKTARLTPEINSQDGIGDFFVRMKRPDKKKRMAF
jgi:hypothetical protein